VKRREFIILPRIGVVYPGPHAGAPPRVQAVLDGLRAGGRRNECFFA
jgi:hypothetical protein